MYHSHLQRSWTLLLLLAIICIILTCNSYGQTNTGEYQSQNVDTLIKKSMPDYAKKLLEKRYIEAKQSDDPSALIKVFLQKLRLYEKFENYDFINIIKALEDEITRSGEPVKSIYLSMLAEMYWGYYKHNRSSIYRKKSERIDLSDVHSWNAELFIKKTTDLYKASLNNKKMLVQTPVDQIDDLLEASRQTRKFRPTLFDFLAYRALEFFRNEERYLFDFIKRPKLQDRRLLGLVDQFLNINFEITDSSSAKLFTLELLQDLLNIHKTEKHPYAFFEANINRLNIAHQYSLHPIRDELYEKSLIRLLNKYDDPVILGRIKWELAYFYCRHLSDFAYPDNTNKIPVLSKAHDFLEDIINSKADSFTKVNAQNLLDKIEQKSCQLTVEDVNIPDEPFRALIKYRNIPSIHIRILKINPEELLRIKHNRNIKDQNSLIKCMLKAYHVKNYFSVDLPDNRDYLEHSVEIAMPSLDPGHYAILFSDKANFSDFSYTTTWISNFSFIEMTKDKGTIYVFDRYYGFPLNNVDVSILMYDQKHLAYKEIKQTKTNELGKANIKFKERHYRYDLELKRGRDRFIYSGFRNSQYHKFKDKKRINIHFFTDRAIYRPGQTIYFKGLVTESYEKKCEIVSGFDTKIKLLDKNRQVLKEIDVESNEYGSFSGSFTLPENVLTGRFRIENKYGSAYIKVEEYKRPQFDFEFEPITKIYQPGDSVIVKGKAFSYAGFPIHNAKVKYTIKRHPDFTDEYKKPLKSNHSRLQYPSRSRLSRLGQIYIDEFIQDSTIYTDKHGYFKIRFLSKLDSLDKYRKPVRDRYDIKATVTDATGESHITDSYIYVSDIALIMNLEFPGKINREKEQKIKLITKNQNRQKINAKGTIKIYKLEEPQKVFRERLWQAPDRFILSKTEYDSLFPHDYYANEDDIYKRKRIKTGDEIPFDSKKDSVIILNDMVNWEEGQYIIESTAIDTFDNEITATADFELFSLKSDSIPSNQLFWHIPYKTFCEPGDTASVLFGSSVNNIHAIWQVLHDGKIVDEKLITKGYFKHTFHIPIKEEHRGNLGYSLVFIKYGRIHYITKPIDVPWTNKFLNAEFMAYQNKLIPGQQEEWRIRFKDYNGDRVAAEFLAALYDASLDFYAKNDWSIRFYRNYFTGNFWRLHKDQIFTTNSDHLYGYSRFDYRIQLSEYTYDEFYLYGFNPFKGEWNYHSQIYPSEIKVQALRKKGPGIYIEGMVVDNETGEPLPGANIIISGTNIGVSTDLQGKFALSIPKHYPLHQLEIEVSYIGYQNLKYSVSGNSNIEIRMNPHLIESEVITVTAQAEGQLQAINQQLSSRAESTNIIRGLNPKFSIVTLDNDLQQSEGFSKESVPKSLEINSVDFAMRKNFNETAFFFPELRTNKQGEAIFVFTMPDAITKWRFLGFAHTKQLQYTQFESSAVTLKPFMVISNPPRFIREGDTLVYSAKLVNLSQSEQECHIQLETFDAETMQPLELIQPETPAIKNINVKAGETSPVKWKIVVPFDKFGIVFQLKAKGGQFTDGEERVLPILPKRRFLTESVPITIIGGQQKEYQLLNLINSVNSKTIDHHKVIFEVSTNPIWTALRSLPYLMDFPYECSEQLFNRFYANVVSAYILQQNPNIELVFKEWQKKGQLISNLEKNQELKNILLQETPWVRDAQNETQKMQRLIKYFDIKRIDREMADILKKLDELYETDGWPWFKGFRVNPYITKYVITGFGKLQKLEIFNLNGHRGLRSKIHNAVREMDGEMLQRFIHLQKIHGDSIKPSSIHAGDIQYFYMRSFYPDIMNNEISTEISDTLLNLAYANWHNRSLQVQAMLAITLFRYGKTVEAHTIIDSLMLEAIHSEEEGIYWKRNRWGWYWYHAPIETQAVLIEAVNEIKNDRELIDAMRLWLLRQKRTQSWPTTKSTSDAVYALICTGTDWLNKEPKVEINLGDITINSAQVDSIGKEAGTGYFKKVWNKNEINSNMGEIKIKAKDTPLAWGGVYWQYFENMDKITAAASDDIKIEKSLFLKKSHNGKDKLVSISKETILEPGDQIVVKLKLNVHRDLEFVHLKDLRAATFEPVTLLSGYKYKSGVGYYESIKDASINFFIDYLRKGIHEIEYSLWVTHGGSYENGIATLQCMYAPEFSAHTSGQRINVK